MTSTPLRIADTVWLALATLHRSHPDRTSFTTAELTAEVRRLAPERPSATIAAHISSHTVANTEPDGGHYRMLIRLDDNSRRLYRPGDPVHRDRKGKTKPKRTEIPAEFHDLLDWYELEYCRNAIQPNDDPIEALWGLGREIWADTDADSYVESLRAGWNAE
jgi:hypothetical protein